MTKRVALITGASRGLGRGTAIALAKQGYTVVGTARTLAAAEATAAEIADAHGVEMIPEQVDVANDEQVAALFERVRTKVGRVDVLVNNAGMIIEDYTGTALTTPAAIVLETLNANTVGAYRMSQHALPWMNEAGYGRIVNVSSGMGSLTDQQAGTPGYRISKTALNAVTMQLHGLAKSGVKVNSVCPGWVRTDMGGPGADRSVDEGIAGIVWAATLDDDGPSGGFFRDGEPIPW